MDADRRWPEGPEGHKIVFLLRSNSANPAFPVVCWAI